MADTFFDAKVELAKVLMKTRQGAASGGGIDYLYESAGTFRRREMGDHFNNGTLFALTGSNSKLSYIIYDFTGAASYTFLVYPTGTGLFKAGDRYLATIDHYPVDALEMAINQVLRDTWIDKFYEDATFLTVKDQPTYTIPSGVEKITAAWWATTTVSPYTWEPKNDFYIDHVNGKIGWDRYPVLSDYRIKLRYEARHGELTADTDTISTQVDLQYLKWQAALYAIDWRRRFTRDKEQLEQLATARLEALDALRRHTAEKEPEEPRRINWGL